MSVIKIYDTSLRDGTQGVDINYSLEDKIAISKALDSMKVDYIEGGFPFSNPKDRAFFQRCQKEHFAHARITSFGSTRKPGGPVDNDSHLNILLETESPAIAIVGKSWTQHVTKVLKTTLDENLAMIFESVEYLKKRGREVVFDAEHFFEGFKEDPEYAVKTLRAATDAGADWVVICDTNGGTLPNEVEQITRSLPFSELSPVGGHFHDDSGTAVANSLAAINHGATQIQGTINGWGERCGNANLCTIIPNIVLKTPHKIPAEPHLKKITWLSRFVAEKANVIPNKRSPYVGDAAFSHKAGLHTDVISKDANLMEHVQSQEVGNERHIILSELAGRSTILTRLSRYGSYTKQSPEVDSLVQILKEREEQGYEYEAAEASFDLLLRQVLNIYSPIIDLRNFHLELFKSGTLPTQSVARIFLNVKGSDVMGAGVGVGPIETLDATIRSALQTDYPFIEKISLSDYRVRVIDSESSVKAKVRVFVTSTDHTHQWNTVGVHQNIVEASWLAIIDSIEYYYHNYVLEKEKTTSTHSARKSSVGIPVRK